MLSPERWRIVDQVFHEALGRPKAERQAFIVSTCGDDAEVRREVESLLTADVSSDSGAMVLKDVVTDWASGTAPPSMVG